MSTTIYENYKTARNKAWEVLIECEISSLPINLVSIIKYYGIKIVKFSDSTLNLTGDGFSLISNGNLIIYYNDVYCKVQRQRFTIAHELGHCLLGHLKNIDRTFCRNIEIDVLDPLEMQANVFARDILMPAIVLHHTKNIKYENIMRICNVSILSAKIRAERMMLLEKRNKFCISPLEKKVYNNFLNYIEINKRHN